MDGWRHFPPPLQETYDSFVALLSTVSLREGEDQIVWMFDNGKFTTNACSAEIQKTNGHAVCMHKDWNQIWSIKGPPKIVSFLWRLKWEILPTRSFLNSRLKDVTNVCAWCGSNPETIPHLFWDCELAKWTWEFISNWWSMPGLKKDGLPFSLLRLLNSKVSSSIGRIWHMVIAAALWSIWLARNELIFKQVRIKKENLVELIYIRVSKWGRASNLLGYGDTPIWRINPQGAVALHSFKLSSEFWTYKFLCFDIVSAVDGSWGITSESFHSGGMGGTIKTKEGRAILTFSGPVLAISAVHAEIQAIIFAINCLASRNIKYTRAVVCSDSITAVNALNKGLQFDFPILYMDFKYQHMINVSIFIHYVPRSLNENADSLAKSGLHRPVMKATWT